MSETSAHRVFCIVAARPNFVKIAPLLQAFGEYPRIEVELIHTGQHYDANMSDVFFTQLRIPEPDVHLGIGSGTHAEQTGSLMVAFEKLCQEREPSLVVVVGDVNATMACALVAAKLHIPVAHVEAGLRSFDRAMPEEINRLVTDSVSNLLFTTSRDADSNLIAEGTAPELIHFTGNVMVDTLLANLPMLEETDAANNLGLAGTDFCLITMHRPSNVDNADTLGRWVQAFGEISQSMTCVCPLHPRTRKQLQQFGLYEEFSSYVQVTDPLGYFEFLSLMKDARIVVTDSGGLQEEATVLGVPCLTIRSTTERPVTITDGTNKLVGTEPQDLLVTFRECLEAGRADEWNVPELWDGNAAKRIVAVLDEYLRDGGSN